MKPHRPKLTYANVVATLALFIAVGGASAFAASQLGKNTVGTKQLKKNSVTTAKIKKEAVTGAKVKKGTLTGTQINASTLGTVPTANAANSANTATTASIANSIVPPEPWHEVGAAGEPDFQNGYSNIEAGGMENVAFIKDQAGFVHLKGGVAAVGKSGVIFQLPAGYRPASGKNLRFAVACEGCGASATTVRAVVLGPGQDPSEAGGVVVDTPLNAVWLEGITFRAES
jgi:hypothetical protein